jgi:small subunit ribosomal protein S21
MVSYREVIVILSKNKHFYPVEQSGICVVQRDGEDGESLIKRFRKKYSKSGLAREVREKMYYEKPSDKKRRKRAQAIRLKEKEDEKLEAMKEKARIRRFKLGKQKNRKGKHDDKSNRRQNSRRRIKENTE